MWTNLDPLTVSQTTIAIHETIESLLDCKEVLHSYPNCRCSIIRMKYGSRPFKCRFLQCSFRRDGFAAKAERNLHERNHDRPWKCSVPTCEYVNGGFLSRNMRDEHLDRYHQEIASNRLPFVTQPHKDEIQPILFDLVTANEVKAVEALLPSIITLRDDIQSELWALAAAQNSVSMLQVMSSATNLLKGYEAQILVPAVQNNANEAFAYLIKFGLKNGQLSFNGYIMSQILKHGSTDIFQIYNSTPFRETVIPIHSNVLYSASFWVNMDIFGSTAGDPNKEQLLLQFWKTHGVLEALEKTQLRSALVNLTKSSCSVRIAERLIKAGADVNYTRDSRSLTPLHHAARNISQTAAELMEFLLQHGADPDLLPVTATIVRVRDEKGARMISKWLGVSWDELVRRTRGYREHNGESGTTDLLEQDEK